MHRADYDYIPVPVLEPADYEAGIDGDSIDMAKAHRVTFELNFGAITGDAVLKFYAGATDAAKTTALAFNYRISGGAFKAASADIYGAEIAVASTGLTLTAATFVHKSVLITIESVDLPDGKPWLTMELSAAASALLLSCHGQAAPLYAGISAPTLLT